jgi:hypothetical protein
MSRPPVPLAEHHNNLITHTNAVHNKVGLACRHGDHGFETTLLVAVASNNPLCDIELLKAMTP